MNEWKSFFYKCSIIQLNYEFKKNTGRILPKSGKEERSDDRKLLNQERIAWV